MKLEHVESYIKQLFNKNNTHLIYHKINHTELVVKMVQKACVELEIEGEDKLTIMTAAWFHDTGYLRSYDDHEINSINIFKEYVQSINEQTSKRLISNVIGCILATKLENKPKNFLESILKDIDIAYALYTDFKKEGEKLRLEKEIVEGAQISETKWNKSQKIFLTQIEFTTEYGKKKFMKLLENAKKAYT